jgi:hypothetical protein
LTRSGSLPSHPAAPSAESAARSPAALDGRTHTQYGGPNDPHSTRAARASPRVQHLDCSCAVRHRPERRFGGKAGAGHPTGDPLAGATQAGASAVDADAHKLLLSSSAYRSSPVDLQGQTVSGNIYVFVSPETGITQARFYIDNPSASGTALWTENNGPWDLAGGTTTTANPYDTRKLSEGEHTITASLSLSTGANLVITSSFTVANIAATATSVPPTATPTRTPTSVSPTATPTRTPTSVAPTATPASGAYSNYLSTSSNRSNPVPLDGRTVSGNIYVFVSPETGITQARFYIDNTSASGTPLQTENTAPWDFAGGSTTTANAYDTRKLSNGAHSITASITLTSGATVVTTASFTVSNITATATLVPPTATPTRTPTSVSPTATPTRTPTSVLPTATPTRTPTSVAPTATPASGAYSNYLSTSSNRSNPVLLQDRTVSGNIYVFLGPDSGITQARFYIDNPSASGTPLMTENTAPWDFAGGSTTTANPYDTRKLSNGAHSITASLTLSSGATVVTTAGFTVSNSAPSPTPTSAPQTGPVYWGVSMSGMPSDMTKLSTWERDVAGKGASIVHWGHMWDLNGGYRPWSSSAVNGVRSHGSIPMISWTPEGGDPSRWQLADIIEGKHDAYIRQFATDAKNWSHPFLLRMMHEMNGGWGWPWQEDSNGNKRGEFVPAWRRIVDIFRSVGANNASFVWCPNVEFPNSPNPTYASLYPGDSYVDWTCLDGYNWGTTRSSGWQSFDSVFSYSYNMLLAVTSSKPVLMGEYGSVEAGGSKAAWLTDALTVQFPGKYAKVRAHLYYNWSTSIADWRIETSSTSIGAWKAGIGKSYYAGNSFGSLTGKVPVP